MKSQRIRQLDNSKKKKKRRKNGTHTHSYIRTNTLTYCIFWIIRGTVK